MNNRRIFVQPDDIIELVEPLGLSVLKLQVLRGHTGNLQVIAHTQPGARLNIDPRQSELKEILTTDLPWNE